MAVAVMAAVFMKHRSAQAAAAAGGVCHMGLAGHTPKNGRASRGDLDTNNSKCHGYYLASASHFKSILAVLCC